MTCNSAAFLYLYEKLFVKIFYGIFAKERSHILSKIDRKFLLIVGLLFTYSSLSPNNGIQHEKLACLHTEAEFLNIIGTKGFRVFLLAIHSHLF